MIRLSPLHATCLTALLCLSVASAHGAEPVAQGAVLSAGAGAALGGGKGAAVGALLGGAGGGVVQTKEQEEQTRWADYYRRQEQEAAQQGAATAQPVTQPQDPELEAPIPTGSALIKEVQRSLIALGYDPGPVDGLTDGATINAIRLYQEDHGLMTTGRVSRDLLIHMRQLLQSQGKTAALRQ